MDRIAEMRTLVAVADAPSFSEAAQRLGLSPPTVTRSIAALERRCPARRRGHQRVLFRGGHNRF